MGRSSKWLELVWIYTYTVGLSFYWKLRSSITPLISIDINMSANPLEWVLCRPTSASWNGSYIQACSERRLELKWQFTLSLIGKIECIRTWLNDSPWNISWIKFVCRMDVCLEKKIIQKIKNMKQVILTLRVWYNKTTKIKWTDNNSKGN